MKLLFTIGAFMISILTYANADTIQVYSNAMHKNIKCVVVTPKNYKTSKDNFPVVYLLHGFAGDYSNWIKKVPVIDSLATVYQMIIVCPDAAFSSWYFDSPFDTTFRYETFTATELPQYIDANFHTIKSKHGRAITGLSMGGHGAIFLTFRHPQTFGACGSMSGALDVSYITNGYDVPKRLGDTTINKHYYTELSAVSQLNKYDPKDSLAIIIDCGTQDFIVMMSREAHQKMLQLKIPHDYTERPGTHDWKYWGNAIKYQLLFFREYFNRNK
jgi:S-formylglutathione hydrolase FrmB